MIDLRIFTEEIFERLDPTQRYFQCICLGELSVHCTALYYRHGIARISQQFQVVS